MTPAASPTPAAARLGPVSLGALLDAVGDAVIVFDSAGQLHLANRAARRLLDVAAARTLDDLAATLDAEALAWLHRLRGTAPPQPVTQPARGADGRRLSLELSRLPGGLWSLLVRPAEVAAAEGSAPEALQQWFDLSPVGMVMVDDRGWLVRSNAAFEALVGRTPLTLDDADESLRELLGWDAGIAAAADAVVERQASVTLADGQRRRLAARLRVIEPAPGQRRLLAVVEDRSAEDERDLARLEIGALMDTAGIGVATFDESRGWLRSAAPRIPGERAAAVAGPRDGAPVSAQTISRELVDPASLTEYERLQRALKSGERVQVRYAVRHPDLGLRWLLTRVEPGRLASGRRTVSVVTLDVTEQERSREQLLLQAERTRAVLDSVLVGIVTVRDGGIEWMNRSARRMFGGELADFVGRPIDAVATADADHPLRRADYAHVLAEGQAETFECQLKARDGRTFWVVGNVVITGQQLTFALLDIERRRQAELRTAQTQASLERIIETAPMAIALLDAASLRVLQLNQMAASFLRCTLTDAVGRPVDELFDRAAAGAPLRDDLEQALATRSVTQREYRRPGSGDAAERIWDARYVPLQATDGAGAGQLLLVASDVTAQRVAEAARLREEIAQRDMLVKEVHHRIKNNLQGVAGLMQQIAERRPEVAAVIKEAVGQVQAIAQVYGLQVGASGPLRIRSVLEAIAASVQRMFGHPISVEVRGAAPHRWALPEAESIPIALTVNELLTNAVKHGAGDAVRCTLECGESAVTIVVANRGTLPPGFDLARVPGGVSGLGLVRALLPRRHAALSIGTVGDEVHSRIGLSPPVVRVLDPL
jgi:PAS domain S-box-containing protein